MVTHVTITGRITIPQSDVGIAARVYATPETVGRVLTVNDRLTIGPVSAVTDTAGNLPTSGPTALQVPTNHGIDGLIWTITAKPLNNASIKHEVLLGRYEITANGTLQSLLEVDQTLVKATAVASLQALVETVETEVAGKVAQAETARAGSASERAAAELARAGSEAARDNAVQIALGNAAAALQGYLESNDLPPDGEALAAQQAAALLDPESVVANAASATLVRLDRQQIDVRDWGVIGDQTSRPLSTLYPSLAAAQTDFPKAQALTDELDWAAMQSLSYARPGRRILVPADVWAIDNLPVDHQPGAVWQIDGTIENIAARNTPSPYMDQAYVFRLGNMHPAVINPASDYAWAAVTINAVTAGQHTVTVSTPGDVATAGVTLSAGDFVIVHSNTNPVAAGVGTIYDYQIINRVVSWDAGTGVLTLEKAIPVAIAAGGKLCINNGVIDTTLSVDQPFHMAVEPVIEGHGKLIGLAPFSGKMGMWKGRLSVRGDFQDSASLQAMVDSYVEIRDSTFTGRLCEVKMFTHDTTVRVRGTYVHDPEVTPATSISIGEQSRKVEGRFVMHRTPEHAANVRAIELWAQDIDAHLEVTDQSTGGQTSVAAIRSTKNVGRPPADIFLRLTGSTLTGKTVGYVQVGTDPDADGNSANDADPTRVTTEVGIRTVGGAAPTYAVNVVRGTALSARFLPSTDVRRSAATAPGLLPEGAPFVTTLSAPSFAGSSETVVGTGTTALLGVRPGDEVTVNIQNVGGTVTGSVSDLLATATVFGNDSVRIYIRNRSGSTVSTTGTLWLWVTYRRQRVA
ncbi:hypothetical protein [Microcystis phage MinS1]|nr:hypothetical protein [Microcystis phage MinS1]